MVECECSQCLRMYTNICKVSDVCQSDAYPSYSHFEVYVIIFCKVIGMYYSSGQPSSELR